MSPIKDLSDSVRLPRLGKIKLGLPPGNGKNYPTKTDYFVLPEDHSDYQKLVEIFGEKPKELRILIPYEDNEIWAAQYYKAYTQTHGLVCKGDGETAVRMIDVKTKTFPNKETTTATMLDTACTGKECPEYKAKKCQEVMNLRFLLPEVPGLGVWQIDTGSINSILNINSCAKMIKKAFGRISLIPLKLTLESIEVNNPESGKKQTVYVLNLRTNVTMMQLAEAAREQAKGLMLGTPDLEHEFDVEVEKEINDLWPETDGDKQAEKTVVKDSPAAKTSKAATPATVTQKGTEDKKPDTKIEDKPAKNIGELLTWVSLHGKKYTRSWLEAQVSDKSKIETDPESVRLEVKALMGW